MIDYLSFFYTNGLGHLPDDEKKINITQDTINYLLDCNITEEKIILALLKAKDKECLRPDTLISNLWDNSLIEQNKFYFHKELQIISKPPVLDIKTGKIQSYPFYKEIKIVYKIEDLLQYYYNKNSIKELFNHNKDISILNFLINKYKPIKDILVLDLILLMIDISFKNRTNISNLISIDECSIEAINRLRKWKKEAKLIGADKIIWRSNKWLE